MRVDVSERILKTANMALNNLVKYTNIQFTPKMHLSPEPCLTNGLVLSIFHQEKLDNNIFREIYMSEKHGDVKYITSHLNEFFKKNIIDIGSSDYVRDLIKNYNVEIEKLKSQLREKDTLITKQKGVIEFLNEKI